MSDVDWEVLKDSLAKKIPDTVIVESSVRGLANHFNTLNERPDPTNPEIVISEEDSVFGRAVTTRDCQIKPMSDSDRRDMSNRTSWGGRSFRLG